MKITDTTLSLRSQHAATVLHEERETLRAWIGNERPDFEGHRPPSFGMPPRITPPVSISEAGKAAQASET